MGWNLRVIHDDRDTENPFHFVAEVYYDGDGNYNGFTHEHGVNMLSESREDLKSYYDLVADAFNKPTIHISEFFKTT